MKVDSSDILIKEVRYNKNILNKPNNIKKSSFDIDKKNYSVLSLLSFMCETHGINKENIDESFITAEKFINEYEGK